MKKKNFYCETNIRLHQLKTSGILQNSGNFNSNETYRMNTISWGSSAAKSADADFDEE